CVYRVGSGRDQHYYFGTSGDDGATWTKPRRMDDQWSVEPQLVCLDNGALLLTGGRPGINLWVSPDGTGETWHHVSLAAHHNEDFADASLHYADECVTAASPGDPAHSTSYTCMKALSADEAIISYDRLGNGWAGAPGPNGPEDVVFTVRVQVLKK
ncbi:unnamed protein product, partial [marine sediment metagenome]